MVLGLACLWRLARVSHAWGSSYPSSQQQCAWTCSCCVFPEQWSDSGIQQLASTSRIPGTLLAAGPRRRAPSGEARHPPSTLSATREPRASGRAGARLASAADRGGKARRGEARGTLAGGPPRAPARRTHQTTAVRRPTCCRGARTRAHLPRRPASLPGAATPRPPAPARPAPTHRSPLGVTRTCRRESSSARRSSGLRFPPPTNRPTRPGLPA